MNVIEYSAIYRKVVSDALQTMPVGVGAWELGVRAVVDAALEEAAKVVEAHKDWKDVPSTIKNAAFIIRCGKYSRNAALHEGSDK